MKIKVTEENIENGIACHAGLCPIALAIGDVLRKDGEGKDKFIIVGSRGMIEIDHLFFEKSTKVAEFVQDFDCGYEVEPFEFELKGI